MSDDLEKFCVLETDLDDLAHSFNGSLLFERRAVGIVSGRIAKEKPLVTAIRYARFEEDMLRKRALATWKKEM